VWQAVALAAVLAAVGSGLSLALRLVTTGGRAGGLDLGPLRIGAHVLVLALTITVVARLWALTTNARRFRAIRRRHRDLADLAGTVPPVPSARLAPAVVRVLRHDIPAAYCVPALRDSRVVVSDGALASLDAVELDAVLAHEHSHLRARHDLAIEVFAALWIAFPRGVRSRVVLDQIRALPRWRPTTVPIQSAAAQPSVPSRDSTGSPAATRTPRSRSMLAAATYLLAAASLVDLTATVAVPWNRAAWPVVG